MIAACPNCEARCRIDRSKLPSGGARVRCPRCQSVFRVRSSGSADPKAAPPKSAKVAEAPAATQPAAALPTETDPALPEVRDSSRLVLIADAGIETGKALAHDLAQWGLESMLVHDGVEAILTIQRSLPRVVILDAALPKMFGFQVCELMKRNDSLRSIQVVLIGSIHHQSRYRRPPSELYGADAYAERPQLPEALRPILQSFGIDVGGGAPDVRNSAPPSAPAASMPSAEPPAASGPEVLPPVADLATPAPSATEPVPAPISAPVPTDPPSPAETATPTTVAPAAVAPPASASVEEDPEIARAERLARIIVSDVVLYNEEKFAAAVRAGNVVEVMDADMQEGRSHFEQRVPAALRASRDFLTEALVRSATMRGAR